jgi:hypothetical protein
MPKHSVGLAKIDTGHLGELRETPDDRQQPFSARLQSVRNFAHPQLFVFKITVIIITSLGLKSLNLGCESATELCPGMTFDREPVAEAGKSGLETLFCNFVNQGGVQYEQPIFLRPIEVHAKN